MLKDDLLEILHRQDLGESLTESKGFGNWAQVCQTRFHFDASGRLVRVEDVGGVRRFIMQADALRKTAGTLVALNEDLTTCAERLAEDFNAVAPSLDDDTRIEYAELINTWAKGI